MILKNNFDGTRRETPVVPTIRCPRNATLFEVVRQFEDLSLEQGWSFHGRQIARGLQNPRDTMAISGSWAWPPDATLDQCGVLPQDIIVRFPTTCCRGMPLLCIEDSWTPSQQVLSSKQFLLPSFCGLAAIRLNAARV